MKTPGIGTGRASTPARFRARLRPGALAMALALACGALGGCGGGDDERGVLGAAPLQRSAGPAPGDTGTAEPGR